MSFPVTSDGKGPSVPQMSWYVLAVNPGVAIMMTFVTLIRPVWARKLRVL